MTVTKVKKASPNKIYVGDNLDVMHGMNSSSVDLIYLDPPFNSKRIYAAPIGSRAEKKAAEKGKTAGFDDIWNWNDDVDIRLDSFIDDHAGLFAYIQSAGEIHGLPMKAYLTFMAQRIIEMHRVLKDSGCLYLHCDPTASHYLKIILDYVFGKHNFKNEIVWHYQTGGASKRHYAKKHDVILFYAKSVDYEFNADQVMMPRTDEVLRRLATGNESATRATTETKLPMDVWTDVQALNPMARERVGYPTQKPLALLDRIIPASSNEGDTVFDPFCGCATTCVAAQNLHRHWIGIDISDVAVDWVTDRLSERPTKSGSGQQLMFSDFTASKTPPVRTDQEKLTWSKTQTREYFYGKQQGNCNGCGTHFDSIHHFDVDHIYPKSKGGAWVLENLQLLCGNCNSIKDNRPMEYLQVRIKARQEQRTLFN